MVPEKKDTETKIGSWFRFLIPKPGFSCTIGNSERGLLFRKLPFRECYKMRHVTKIGLIYEINYISLEGINNQEMSLTVKRYYEQPTPDVVQ